MIVSLVVFVVIVALSLPSAVVFIPLAILTGNVEPLYWVGCSITRVGFFVAGIRIHLEGRQSVPAGQACIFMANHVSNLDPPALIPRIPGRTSVFMKRSLMKIPILGICFRLGEFIPVERGGSVHGAQESVAAARKVIESGVHITTFVEGTRSPDGHMLPFKKGPFYLAMQTGAPCIPVSIHGTETLMAKGKFGIKPGTVQIVFHAPLHPADFATREELSEAVRAAIASGLPEWMRA
jgi:1-acyl-sn-glycerol-3-phosphate acyltransferase